MDNYSDFCYHKISKYLEDAMNQIERRDKGLAYVCDDEAFAQQAECRKILQQLNFMDRSDFDGIKEVVKQLLGKSDEAFINPPFYT